jgi:hypothetical protein
MTDRLVSLEENMQYKAVVEVAIQRLKDAVIESTQHKTAFEAVAQRLRDTAIKSGSVLKGVTKSSFIPPVNRYFYDEYHNGRNF